MEYKILKIIWRIRIPFIIRIFFAIFIIFISIFVIVLPLFPGSLFVWISILALGILLLKPRKVKYVIKIRKSLIYLFINITKKRLVIQKIYDIKKNIKRIIRDKKIKIVKKKWKFL